MKFNLECIVKILKLNKLIPEYDDLKTFNFVKK